MLEPNTCCGAPDYHHPEDNRPGYWTWGCLVVNFCPACGARLLPNGEIERRGEGLQEELREAASDYWVKKAFELEYELAQRGETVGEGQLHYIPGEGASSVDTIQMTGPTTSGRVLLVRPAEPEEASYERVDR